MTRSPAVRVLIFLVESAVVLLGFAANLHYAHSASFQELNLFAVGFTLKSTLFAFAFLAAWLYYFSEFHGIVREQLSFMGRLTRWITGFCVLTSVLVLALCASPTRVPLRYVLAAFFLWAPATTLILPLFARLLERLLSFQDHNVIVLGTGPIARRAWKEIRTRHFRSLRIVGFVDTHCLSTAPPEIQSRYLGRVDALNQIVLQHAVDLIVIALPAKSCYEAIQVAIHIAEQAGLDLVSFQDMFQRQALASSRRHPGQNYPHLLFAASLGLGKDLSYVAKRAFDLLASAALLLCLSPLLLLTGLAIKLTSPGPALFIQERYGHRRRKFRLLKFRTMVADAEKLLPELERLNEAVGPIFKMKRDPRVTPIGRFLRKTSLDELPQLWNVLTGSMSLVGPRPMSLRDVHLFSQTYLMRRFRVRPGITGLWQVSGRSNTTFEDWIRLDFSYIDQWSLSLDFLILLKTIPAVLRGSGAM